MLVVIPTVKYSDTYGTSWEFSATYNAYSMVIPTVHYSDKCGTLWNIVLPMALSEKYSDTYHAYSNSYYEIQWYLCTMVHVIPIVLTVKYSDTYGTSWEFSALPIMSI